MEAVEAFLDGEWESLSKLFSCEGSDNFLLNFNSSNLLQNNREIPPNFFAAGGNVAEIDGSLFLPSDDLDTSFNYVSQESSSSSETENSFFTSLDDQNHRGVDAAAIGVNFLHDCVTADTFESMDICIIDSKNNGLLVPFFPDDLMEEIFQAKAQICNDQSSNAEIQPGETNDSCKEMQLNRKCETPEDNSSDQSRKKSARASRDTQRSKKNSQSKKNKKASNVEQVISVGGNGHSSSTCSSKWDDSNASQELNGASTSESKGAASIGKSKASKGPAIDPQSLYARKRRERINERLRILQNLVPNGTKVDISTMLEEAVHYVKFLQLQIKLLSSTNLWMYAPIAYNGMDIGLYHKILPNLWPQNLS